MNKKKKKKKPNPFAKGKPPAYAKGGGSPQQELAAAMQNKGYSSKGKVPPQFAKKG